MAKSNNAPYAKGRRRCIYCGGFGMSKEHMWADWLKKYIPRDMPRHRSISTLAFPDRSKNQVKVTRHEGDPHSRRLRIVCKNCNEGWMGKLQERTKPYLEPMLLGERVRLYKNGQTALAAWITMFVMTADFLDETKVSIPDEERRWFRRHHRAPAHWRIWVGKYKRERTISRWFHYVLTFIKDESEAVPDGTLPMSNTQTSTILLGEHLVIHVMSSPIARRIIKRWRLLPAAAPGLIQIWPITEGRVFWPPGIVLDEETIGVLAAEFFDRCDIVGRRREGITC